MVAIVQFREGKMASETLYWDQASVLVQLGLLTAETLPISGVESARKVLDPTLPSNALIERARARKSQKWGLSSITVASSCKVQRGEDNVSFD